MNTELEESKALYTKLRKAYMDLTEERDRLLLDVSSYKRRDHKLRAELTTALGEKIKLEEKLAAKPRTRRALTAIPTHMPSGDWLRKHARLGKVEGNVGHLNGKFVILWAASHNRAHPPTEKIGGMNRRVYPVAWLKDNFETAKDLYAKDLLKAALRKPREKKED